MCAISSARSHERDEGRVAAFDPRRVRDLARGESTSVGTAAGRDEAGVDIHLRTGDTEAVAAFARAACLPVCYAPLVACWGGLLRADQGGRGGEEDCCVLHLEGRFGRFAV